MRRVSWKLDRTVPGRSLPESVGLKHPKARPAGVRWPLLVFSASAMLGIACADDPAEPTPTPTPVPAGDPSPTPLQPTDYIYDAPPPPEPLLDAETLGSAMVSAIQNIFTLSPEPVMDAYVPLEQGADPDGCPYFYRDDGSSHYLGYWFGECIAQSGNYFSGYGYREAYNDYDQGDGGFVDGWALYMSGQITDPAGNLFQGAGAAYNVDYLYPAADYVYSVLYLDGTFVARGPDTETAWMDGEALPSITVFSAYVSSVDGNYLALSGGLGGLTGSISTLSLSEVAIFDEAMGSSCASEPAGTISVRDTNGEWYDVVFDGPTEDDPITPKALCDGCGMVYYRGEYVFDTCADFSPLLTWEGYRPW